MSTIAKRIGMIGVAGACLIAGAASPADAGETRYRCNMTGTWVEDRDNFGFAADYVAKDGPDTFTGGYANASAGTTANVVGNNINGNWTIILIYTDAKHRGYSRELRGPGKYNSSTNQINIKGGYVSKQDGRQTQAGNFLLNGVCKK